MKNNKKEKKGTLIFSYNAVIESINNKTGKVVKRIKVHNTIVDTGLERIAKLLGKLLSSGFDYIAVGTDDTAVQNTDIALGTEVEREQASVSYVPDYKCRFEKVFSVGSGVDYVIKEVGIFDSVLGTGTTMWARLNCNNILDADTDLAITITYIMARSQN